MAVGTLPPELFAEQQQLNRQQQMAQMLMQQGTQQPQGQMVSGQYVKPSIFAQLAPLAQLYAGTQMLEKGDKKALDLAAQLRKRQTDDLAQYQNLMNPVQTELAGPTPTGARLMTANEPDRQAANLFAANSYNPALQALGMKRLTEGPKWEKAELPNPDGSIRKGWVDYNASNPLSTFVEGGTKPAFTSLEAARFQYDTGMRLPSGGGAAPMNMPMGGSPAQMVGGNMPTSAMPSGSMPAQSPAMGGGRGMSPAAMNEANKQIFVDSEKRRIENLEKSPQVIATMTDTLRNIDDLIGDARVIKDSKGKEKIDYTVTQDGKQVQGRKPLAGFETAVGFGLPSYLTPAGTDASNFKIRLDQIKDKTFLQAFESLKGAGQITEREGEKATSALNRMNSAQSEVEFIKAAREFEENVRNGMELAKRKTGSQAGGAPSIPSPRLRWNPTTNSWQ
jgi:hypothetical protein